MSGDPGVRLTEELRARESALATRDPSLLDEPLEGLLDADFVEFGASGNRWTREDVLEVLADPPRVVEMLDFRVTLLAAGLVLVTYRSVEPQEDGSRVCRRSSLWALRDGRWRMRFHQGTPMAERGD